MNRLLSTTYKKNNSDLRLACELFDKVPVTIVCDIPQEHIFASHEDRVFGG